MNELPGEAENQKRTAGRGRSLRVLSCEVGRGRTRGATERDLDVGTVKDDGLLGELVEVGGERVRRLVGTQLWAQIVCVGKREKGSGQVDETMGEVLGAMGYQ